MREYFKEKVAVVTGAASGIGSGLTKHLLANGAKAVFMGDLNQETLTKEARRLGNDFPGKVQSLTTDVTKLDQVENLIHKAKEFDGHLDFDCEWMCSFIPSLYPDSYR